MAMPYKLFDEGPHGKPAWIGFRTAQDLTSMSRSCATKSCSWRLTSCRSRSRSSALAAFFSSSFCRFCSCFCRVALASFGLALCTLLADKLSESKSPLLRFLLRCLTLLRPADTPQRQQNLTLCFVS